MDTYNNYTKKSIWKWVVIYIAIAIVAYVLIYYFFMMNQRGSYNNSVNVYNGPNGQYLVDNQGMSLYYFANDTAGKNNCTGVCASNWPVFYVDNLTVDPSLMMSDFKTIVSNGSEQLTYKDQPLYYYVKDAKPGDILGNGFGGVWFLAKP